MKFQHTFVHKKPAPAVASYASRGPSRSVPYVLKPDVMAPGSIVLGAWLPNKLKFSVEFGTSVACPHVAGVAALLKAAHPNWSVAAIRSAIVTAANPLDNTHLPILDNPSAAPATPLAMGAGRIDPNQALHPGLIYDAFLNI